MTGRRLGGVSASAQLDGRKVVMVRQTLSVKTASGPMLNTLDELVGKRLRMRRRLLGLSQKELGARVGLRFQQIHKLECGAIKITCARLFDLANALGMTPDSLLEGLTVSSGAIQAEPKELSLTELCSQATAMNLLRAFHKMDKARQRMLVDVALALGGDAERSAGPAQALAS